MAEKTNEIHLEGVPISEGIGIGTFYLSKGKEIKIPEFAISSSQVSYEIARYRRAISTSREELQNLHDRLETEGSDEVCSIIDTHIQMLSDPIISTSVEEKISHMQQNTESVFMYVMNDYTTMFKKHLRDDCVHDRLLDIKDLSNRILSHLNTSQTGKEDIEIPNSIYADYEITPSKAAEAKKWIVEAFVSKIGGEMSHSGVIARAKGIPFVSGIDLSLLEDLVNKTVIVDGCTGMVIINPSEATLQEYTKKSSREKKEECFDPLEEEHVLTKDKKKVSVSANFDCMDDLNKLCDYKVESVGLIRTEFLFLHEAVTTLSMQFQVEKYEEIIEKANGARLTFRLFDVGSDKKIIEMEDLEPNPALGCRSIRFLMKYPKIFSMQVKALYQASLKGNIRILLPLVTDYDELTTALSFIESARKEMGRELELTIPKVPVGCMVEVPSFALLADHFAKVCDFFSIGTNDLMQYTLAMDRICPESECIFQMYHPSILHLIHKVVLAADNAGIEVSICGEAASNEKFTKLLLGLGINNFSCSMRYIPTIRKVLREISTIEAKELAGKALLLPSINQVLSLLETSEKLMYS